MSSYFDIEIDLARRAHGHIVRVDFLRLGLSLDVFGVLVLFAFEPEFDVFVAELGL